MRTAAVLLIAAVGAESRILSPAHPTRQDGLDVRLTAGAAAEPKAAEESPLLRLQRELPEMLGSSGIPASTDYALWGVKLTKATNAAEEAQQLLLLRTFLTSNQGDPLEARRKLERTIRWRRTIGERPAGGFGHYPTKLLLRPGLSERPTLVLDVGTLPAEAFSDAAKLVQWWVAMHDAMYTRVFASGSPCFNFIVDCSGLRRYHFGTAARFCAGQLAPVLNEHYPDQIAGETLVINSPAWFRAAFVVLRPFLPRSFVKTVRLTRMMDAGPCVELTPTDVTGNAGSASGPSKLSLDSLRQRWLDQGQKLARGWGDGSDGARQRLRVTGGRRWALNET